MLGPVLYQALVNFAAAQGYNVIVQTIQDETFLRVMVKKPHHLRRG